jgi:prepilin-type N-terminal cleavage/methylation domain-containing protein
MRSTGFSLIELLIVIVILGVVAKAAIPIFSSSSEEQKLDQAASEIIQALRYARSEAMRQGTCIEVNVEPDGLGPQPTTAANRVLVQRWSNCSSSAISSLMQNPLDKKNYLFTTGLSLYTSGATTSNVDIQPSSFFYPYRVYFYSDGTPKVYTLGYVTTTKCLIEISYNGKKRVINVNSIGNIS